MSEQEFFLRVKDVAKMLGIKPGTVWKWVREEKLPKPRKISPKCSVWRQSDIAAFQAKASQA